MPTSYTSKIYDGTSDSFKDYVLRCAHGFSGFGEIPIDAPLVAPDVDKELAYYRTQAVTTGNALVELSRLTQTSYANLPCHRAAVQDAEEMRAQNVARAARYDAMIEKVSAWVPPTQDHAGLKRLMYQQLKDGRAYDCHDNIPPNFSIHYRLPNLEKERSQVARNFFQNQAFAYKRRRGVQAVAKWLEDLISAL